jgi:hypothetical protein
MPSRLGAAHVFSQGDTGVVARLYDHALHQVFHGYLLAHLDEHARTLGTPGLLTDGDHVAELDLARRQFVEQHIGGHQLGQAGRFQGFIRVFAGQYLPGVLLDQQVTPRIYAGRIRNRRQWLLGLGQG